MRIIFLIFTFLVFSINFSFAQDRAPLPGYASDPMVDAQEKLLSAKGHYESVKQQEKAIKDLRKAAKLGWKASKLRTKAEQLQAKADGLINKATQNAVTRGLYITNPLSPVMMQPPPEAMQQSAKAAPIPGSPINIIVPRQETVSYDQDGFLPAAPVPGF